MFNWFKKDTYPELDTIRSSPIRNQYFHRIARYHWMDEQEQAIAVMHPVDAKLITMDDWPQIVFLDAVGDITVKEYTFALAKRFPRREVTSDFDKNILYQIEQLTDLGIVALSDTPVQLPSEFAAPYTK